MTKIIKNKKVYEQNIQDIEGKASAIMFPDSVEEIINAIRVGDNNIVIRAGGSSFNLNTLPKDSLIIDVSKMNKISSLNLEKKTIIVEPGVMLQELNDVLSQYELEFPIIPLFSGIETIGGMLAKNSSGSREVKYNRMINWVDWLEIIEGNGELKKISKSDLSDVIGMEGTTGIIMKACLRLTSKKKRSLVLLKSEKISDILEATKRLRLKQDICSIDLLSKEISSLLGLENKYHLFVESDSEEGMFKAEEYIKFFKLKNKAYNKIAEQGFYLTESIKISLDSIEDFLIFLESRKIPFFAYFSSGVFYPCFGKNEQEKAKFEETLALAKRLKSKIAYNSGIGELRKNFLELSDKDLFRRVKLRYDANFKLNKNKFLDFKPKIVELVKEKIKEEVEEEKIEKQQEIIEQPPQQEPDKININNINNINNPNPETTTLKRPEKELTEEEREKVKKIAFGFFGGKPKENKE
jgi:FAD/FMN-containing dehydrogenase